jgi:multidrug efflux pump subunit AcrA (membrane-fusion protein)
MYKKYRMWILALLIVVSGVVISQVLSSQKEPIRKRPNPGGTKPVKVITVENRDLSPEINLSGPLYAYDKVELYAEVSGVLLNTQRRFKEGLRFKKDEVLLRIDDRVYRNNVLAQKSSLLNQLTLMLPDLSIDFPESVGKWEEYLQTFQLEKPLPPLPDTASDQERYYVASRNIYNLYYTIKSMEETLSKYSLEAPYDGVVTQSGINPGTLVRVGQKLGEFTNTALYEMEASAGLQDAERLAVGQKVLMTSEDVKGSFEGTVQRMNSVIDRASMTIKVYIHTRSSRLREGMYMTARVRANPLENVCAIDRDLLIDGRKIYALRDSVLELIDVTVAGAKGDRVFIRGLKDGSEILGEAWAEARPGIRLPASVRPEGKMVGSPGRGASSPNQKRDEKDPSRGDAL